MKRALFAILMAGVAVAAAVPAQAATPLLSFTGGRPFDGDGPWTLGFDFSVNADTTASGLGVYDAGQDGFATPHAVGLWNSSGTLLASATVGSGNSLIGLFRYASISPITLLAGQTYTVGAADVGAGDGYWLDATVSTIANANYLSAQYIHGSGLQDPNTTGTLGGYFGANVLLGDAAVPEPATWAMMLVGFGLVGAAMRKSRHRPAVRFNFT
jgi:hypothetical protein